jgi:hypothetical protein
MSFDSCCTCGHKFDKKNGEVIWCGGGILEISHGGGQCKECYKKNHKWCIHCDKPVSDQWIYCPWCGVKVSK